MTEMQIRAQRIRDSLARAVADALEKKRRLGQYAVIFRDGRPVRVFPEPAGATDHGERSSESPEVDGPDSSTRG